MHFERGKCTTQNVHCCYETFSHFYHCGVSLEVLSFSGILSMWQHSHKTAKYSNILFLWSTVNKILSRMVTFIFLPTVSEKNAINSFWYTNAIPVKPHSQKQSAHWAVDVTAQVVPCWLGSWLNCNFWLVLGQWTQLAFQSSEQKTTWVSYAKTVDSGEIQPSEQKITWLGCIWTPESSLHLTSPLNWLSTETWLRWWYTVGWAISSESAYLQLQSWYRTNRSVRVLNKEGSGTLLVRLYKDAGTPSTECSLTKFWKAGLILDMIEMLFGYRHYDYRKCPTSFRKILWMGVSWGLLPMHFYLIYLSKSILLYTLVR